MNYQLLRHLGGTVILALLLAINSGCSRAPASRIEGVLNRCAEISRKASSLQADYAQKAGYIADSFQAVDTSGCPADFRAAFQQHVNAWRQAQIALAGNTMGANFTEGFMAGFSGDPSQLGQTQGRASASVEDVNATYYNLTVIAARYGAQVPSSVTE